MIYKLSFALILILAFILRIIGISSNYGLIYDELFSWNIASNSVFDLFKLTINIDYHPPLYYLLLHFWIGIFDDSDIMLKLLSVIFSISSVVVVYKIGKNLKDKLFGLVLSTIFSISFVFAYTAQTVRFYQMGLFFALLLVLFSIKLINNFDNKKLIYYSLSALFLLYTQTTGLIFVGINIVLIGVLIYIWQRTNFLKYLKAMGILFIAYIPQLIIFLVQLVNSKKTFWEYPWEWSVSIKPTACILSLFNDVTIGSLHAFCPYFMKIIIIFAVILLSLFIALKNKDKKLIYLLFISVIPISILFALNALKMLSLLCNLNYFLINLAVFLILFCYIFSKNMFLISIILALNVVSAFLTFNNEQYFNKVGEQNFGAISNYIKQNKHDNCLIFNLYGDFLIKKYDKNYKTFGIYSDNLFTMSTWKNTAKLLFDADLSNLNKEKREEEIKKFLFQKEPQENFKKLYNENILKIKKDEYLIVAIPIRSYYNIETFNGIISDSDSYKISSKSLLTEVKIYHDILRLISKDKRLKFDSEAIISQYWKIYIFRKIQ